MYHSNQISNWVIYKITSPSGRVYIGKSARFSDRLRNYKCSKAASQPILNRSFLKYGFNCHEIEIIDSFYSDNSFASGKEMFWIKSQMSNFKKYPNQRGMNVTDGGEGITGAKKSDKEREMMRNRNLGKKASEETKTKMSMSMMGKNKGKKYIRSASSIAKQISKTKGREFTKEQKEKYKNSILNRSHRIIQINIGGEIIEHNSIGEAARLIGCNTGSIHQVLKGKSKKIATGSTFKYAV